MSLKFIVLGGIMGVLTFTPIGFAEIGHPISMEEAVHLALQNNPLIAASKKDVSTADAERIRARGTYLPKLEISQTYMRTNQPVHAFGTLLNQSNFTSADFAVDRLNHPDPLDNFRTVVTLHQPVYNGGREFLNVRRAEAGDEIARQSYESTRQQVIFDVIEAYLRAVWAKQKVAVAQEAQRVTEADYDIVRSRYENGMVVKSDFLGSEVRLAEVREERIQAENAEQIAKLALKNAIGIKESMEVRGGLEKTPEALPDLDWLKTFALTHRPDYQALQKQIRQAETEVELARAAFLPNLNLQGTYELNNQRILGNGSDSYTLFASVRFNLFNGLEDWAGVQQANAQFEKKKYLLYHLAQKIDLEITDACLKFEEARERVRIHENTVVHALENLRIIRNRYRAGITNIIDLLNAEHLLTRAQTARINSLFDLALAKTRVELATGILGKPGGWGTPS